MKFKRQLGTMLFGHNMGTLHSMALASWLVTHCHYDTLALATQRHPTTPREPRDFWCSCHRKSRMNYRCDLHYHGGSCSFSVCFSRFSKGSMTSPKPRTWEPKDAHDGTGHMSTCSSRVLQAIPPTMMYCMCGYNCFSAIETLMAPTLPTFANQFHPIPVDLNNSQEHIV